MMSSLIWLRMLSKNEVVTYYASNNFVPTLPGMPSFRHFRVRNVVGGWRKVPEKISSADELKKWAVKLGGVDIYYSSACWLNPHKISTKGSSGSYLVADNLLLNSDLIFDVDADNPICEKSLETARRSALDIYKCMKKKNDFDLQYLAWTGGRGFRLAYAEKDLALPKNPCKRIEYLEQKRKYFIQELHKELKKTTKFDEEATTNPMGVFRVLGTTHGKTGYLTHQINITTLRKPIKKILKEIPFITKKWPGIPKKGEMTQRKETQQVSPRTRLSPSEKDVSGPASSLVNEKYAYRVSNKVLGIKRGFVPFLIYPETYTHWKTEVKRLQKRYKLGHVYVARVEGKILAVSLKTMQKRQLQKVLNSSSSYAKLLFIRHGRILAPMALSFPEIIPGNFTGNLSLGHQKYVRPGTKPKPNHVGWPKIEISRGERKNG